MQDVTTLTDALGRMPLTYLLIFVALAALGVAAYAIHAVFSMAKVRSRQ